jgi:TonB family protein
MNHIPEILLSNLFLLFIWGFFELFLRNTKSFHANRFFLLAGSVLAVALPWLPWQVRIPVYTEPIISMTEASAAEMMVFDPLPAGDFVAMPPATPINWPLMIYFTVVGILVLTFLAQTVRMYLWTRRRPVTRWDRYRVVELNKQWPAFSFFGTIYFPEPFEPDKRETITILEHERVHARQLHSLDNILLLAIRILFFYNPAVHFLAGRLRLTHEYLADAATAGANKVEYSQTLIRHQFLVPRLILMHSFNNQSFLTRRLNMLLKNNTSSRAGWLYLLAAPLAAGMIVLSGWSASAQNPQIRQVNEPVAEETLQTAAEVAQLAQPQDQDKKVFLIVDEMPTFQGGKIDAFRNWVQYNIKYPDEAKQKKISGTVYISFIVDTTGKAVEPQVVRSADPLLDAEVMRVISTAPLWNPGKQRGKLADVKFSIPIKFVLAGAAPVKEPAVTTELLGKPGKEEKQVFLIVEEMPTFQGGKINDFRNWLQDNLKYPTVAKANKIQGTVYVSFIIDTLGHLGDINLVRGVDPVLDEEAIRVVKSSPVWNPGKQRGRNVNVSFSLPIVFKLGENGETVQPPREPKPPVKAEYNGQQVFLIVEDMPTFQGGTIENFRNWVQTNVKYPELAKEKKISGTEYVSFIVDTTGRVVNPKIVRSADPILDAEILRVLCSAPLWNPGKQRGQLVNVAFSIPVKFILEGAAGDPAKKNPATGTDSTTKVRSVNPAYQGVASGSVASQRGNTVFVDGIRVKAPEKSVFMIVEEMPEFRGGDIKKFVKWAHKNVKYPAIAMENSIYGTVEVSFIVSTTGQVEDVTIEKSLDPALDEAAINVVKSSPVWTPGKQRGKNVNVSFKIPIEFKRQ